MNSGGKIESEFIIATSEKDFAIARKLFLEYAASLSFDLCFQDFDRELNELEEMYNPEDGGIILLKSNELDDFVGCAGIRRIDRTTAELKRMYLREVSRGKGLGEQLLQLSIKLAKSLTYTKIRLDTMPSMTRAISLYRKYGYTEIEAYRYNPDINALFLELSF
jgi:ribosomal protein S18 acetylase RimI-like enzyme